MDRKTCSPGALAVIRRMQQNEVTESAVYRALADRIKDDANRQVLLRLAEEEAAHARVWQDYTGEEMRPQKGKVLLRKVLCAVFGFTFTVKLMEKGEDGAQDSYLRLAAEVPEATAIREQENAHENALLDMLDEERLRYVGSMVLGLNDALVELTGTLAGLTFALQNTRLVALSGLITGVAATLSMASSEFLSAKAEGNPDALKSSVYTGVAYLITVALLVLPYLLFGNEQYGWALGVMLALVVLILLVFNYYIAVAKSLSFGKRFGQMAAVSLGVAALSFGIGLLVKRFLGVDI